MSPSRSTNVFVTVGVGGVGKTTVSASLGIYLAKSGKKTLVITIDPARRLAQNLGLNRESKEPTLIQPWGLYGLVLNIPSTFDRIVRKFAPQPDLAEQIIQSSIYQNMVQTLVGTQELIAVELLHEHFFSGQWDVIILDTPPSKHVVDFFDSPERLSRFFGGPSARWFARMAKGTRIVVKAFSLFWGAHFLEELMSFFVRMESFFEGFASRSNQVMELFKGSQCTLYFVTTPERYELNESKSLRDEVSVRLNRPVQTIVNRVIPSLPDPPRLERLQQAGMSENDLKKWENSYKQLAQRSREQHEWIQAHPEWIRLEQVDFEVSDRRTLERLSTQFGSFHVVPK